MANFPFWIPDCYSHIPAFLDLFIYSDGSIFSAVAFPHWEVLIMLVSQFSLAFHQTQNGMCPLSLHGL